MSLGVGLIGTGYMGKCHALAWNAVAATFGDPRPRLVHLAEVDAALARSRADAFGFARSTADWRELVADPAVDVVSITAPNAFHADMAVAALEAGKHVWCEKPMATSEADAARMLAAARASGRVAVLGYNYIQSPAVRHIGRLLDEGAIGRVTHVRLEMDEDFMADGMAPFGRKDTAAEGYGALDDFAVHPLSLIHVLFGRVTQVVTDQSRPHVERPGADGSARAVESHDVATTLFRLASGASGLLAANRSAWGRKGRIALQIYGTTGAILFDQERANELQLYSSADRRGDQGYRTILMGPDHPPYGMFCPAPGHGLGFNDLKVIEAHELIAAIDGRPARVIDFTAGFAIERTVHAMARSFATGGWIDV